MAQFVGLGGGGAIFDPKISPNTSRPSFISCDMTGLYQRQPGSASWVMVDQRELTGSGFGDRPAGTPMGGFSVAFHPQQDMVVGFRRFQGFKSLTPQALGRWSLISRQS